MEMMNVKDKAQLCQITRYDYDVQKISCLAIFQTKYKFWIFVFSGVLHRGDK